MHEHNPEEPLPRDFDWNDLYSGEEGDYMPPDALLLELVEGLTPGHALDVGCGAGGLMVALAKLGWRVHGIDVAKKAVEAAKKVLSRQGVQADLEVADAAGWRPSRTYDLVTNCFALPMSRADQVQVYRNMRDAVAPGGTVIIKEFDPQMRRLPAFSGFDPIAVEHLTEAFEGFEVLRAEVVDTPEHDHGQGTYGEQTWTASLLVARRPNP